jgi:hypothetical protein
MHPNMVTNGQQQGSSRQHTSPTFTDGDVQKDKVPAALPTPPLLSNPQWPLTLSRVASTQARLSARGPRQRSSWRSSSTASTNSSTPRPGSLLPLPLLLLLPWRTAKLVHIWREWVGEGGREGREAVQVQSGGHGRNYIGLCIAAICCLDGLRQVCEPFHAAAHGTSGQKLHTAYSPSQPSIQFYPTLSICLGSCSRRPCSSRVRWGDSNRSWAGQDKQQKQQILHIGCQLQC